MTGPGLILVQDSIFQDMHISRIPWRKIIPSTQLQEWHILENSRARKRLFIKQDEERKITRKSGIPELSDGLGHVAALDRDLPFAAVGLHLGLGHGHNRRGLHIEILLEGSKPVQVGANLRFSFARGLVAPAVVLRTAPESRITAMKQERHR